ncbi:TraB/GumN family protein [Providencia vermicola]|uniref:TraB/GumN family protein n=2 Tax=Providencia TaxID=586 RepID=A0AAI9HZW4_PROST|nr:MULTISPECIES: TraB/GumN family protein [Providencia]ELR5035856.1 TraB/GumN family protein [Providencia stuartii]ELR5121899.1 TraB/GumN family protein [Providencia stuartii]ELR5140835.1 TraB/GumN family protein [Providencia stuartii]ELX8379381.1 TraB/GumN family protein [Providencia stuartii]EMD5258585.1 TraB/GumN family protein [Providencia stuartii]
MAKLLESLKNWLHTEAAPVYPYPAVDIRLSKKLKLHIVGSIHMGTENMFPLSEILLEKLNQADALIVESDITDMRSPFTAGENAHVPLQERLTATEYALLLSHCQEIHQEPTQFDSLPSWQVALILQATQAQGLGLHGRYGIDYQLLCNAQSQQKKIIELEGIDTQIELLLTLPEEGLALLRDTLVHWRTNARSLQTMISWWLDFQPNNDVTLPKTFSDEVYHILMEQRNQAWSTKLRSLPDGYYVVAVGALHLFGDGSLVDHLRN